MELWEIEQEVQKINKRNLKVEADKAWEISVARKLIITVTTYVVAGLALSSIDNENPWRNALIPSLGYFLSTQSLPFLKKYWVDKYMKNNDSQRD